jgi:hypothetical protein
MTHSIYFCKAFVTIPGALNCAIFAQKTGILSQRGFLEKDELLRKLRWGLKCCSLLDEGVDKHCYGEANACKSEKLPK